MHTIDRVDDSSLAQGLLASGGGVTDIVTVLNTSLKANVSVDFVGLLKGSPV